MNTLLSPRLRKFFSYYQPHRRLLAADLACAFVVSAIVLALPLCARYITTNVLEASVSNPLPHIFAMGAVMLALILIHMLCNTFVDYRGHMMGTLMESDMRNELFAHYQKLSFSFYDDHKTGQLMTRLTNDLQSLSEFYHHGPEDVVIATLKFFGTFVILMTINVPLTLILFALMPFVVWYSLHTNKRLNRAMRISRDRIGDINAQAEDTLAGIRVVQSFANEDVEQGKFERENRRFVESRRDVYRCDVWFYEPLVAFTQLLPVIVVVFGGAAIVQNALSLPDMLTYLLYVGILIEPIQRYVNFARLYQEGVTGFDRFMDMLDVQPDIEDAPDAIELAHVRGNIAFHNVSFQYREDQDHVLKSLCLDIRAGEYVALVGPSGVGKTTLCSLIPRFYEVSAGTVTLDGIDIRDIHLRALRRHIGIVHQDVYLFAGTVADNIRYGQRNATHDEIVAAARQANAHDFIMALPHGYDTDIGQRGVKLSGGQKQRLSIARAFLKDPPVIIFDEATSALDNESERAIRASLERLSNHRTTLVIAHRLSTIRNASRILVLSEEGIAEQGTHEVLIAAGGLYANLYGLQWMQP
jgi:ATP-binding cassette subfamily B protein